MFDKYEPGFITKARDEFDRAVRRATHDATSAAETANSKYNQLMSGLEPPNNLPHHGTCPRSFILHFSNHKSTPVIRRVTCELDGDPDHWTCQAECDWFDGQWYKAMTQTTGTYECDKNVLINGLWLYQCCGPWNHAADHMIVLEDK